MKTNDVYKIILKYDLVFIFLIVFIIYNINFRLIGSGDSIPASLLPFSILDHHNINFDQFAKYYQDTGWIVYFFWNINGHYISAYPIVTSILITPLYIIPYAILNIFHCPLNLYDPSFMLCVNIMEKISASFITSLSCVFIYLSLKELISKKNAIICSFVYAFATSTWSISSQGLWQHGMSELILSMIIYIIIINTKSENIKNIIYIGLLSGLYIFNRPSDSILLIPALIYVISYRNYKIIIYLFSVVVSSAPFAIYNYYYFGSILGGYNSTISSLVLNYNTITNYIGLLISPSRGIIIYTPIVLMAIVGLLNVSKMNNSRIKQFLYVSTIAIIIQILIYSIFKVWWAGWSYGPRFLTCILPLMAIFISLSLPENITLRKLNKKETLILVVFILLLIPSIFSQFVGTFYYPNGNWDGNPSIDLTTERLWNWSDTQIMRSFDSGMSKPNLKPIFNLL